MKHVLRSTALRLTLACLFCWGTLIPLRLQAATAVDGSWAAVNSALADTPPGGTLTIPAGPPHVWDRVLYVNKAITIEGAGPGQTIIVDEVLQANGQTGISSTYKKAVICIIVPTGQAVTLKGIEIRGSDTYNTPYDFDGALLLGGDTSSMRITNCFFNEIRRRSIQITHAVWGVMDNSVITQTIRDNQGILIEQSRQYGGTNGDGAWENPVGWGGPEFFFFENCTFNMGQHDAVIDAGKGAKFVVRHCTIYNTNVGGHGTDSGARGRGTRAIEFYENTIIRNFTSERISVCGARSGGLVAFNNTATGNFKYFAGTSAYRSYTDYAPWGPADGTHAWDVNSTADPGPPTGETGDLVANDGIFESGTVTGNGGVVLRVDDSSKDWEEDQWKDGGYVLRLVHSGTATSGGIRTLTVSPSPGWQPDQWKYWQITKSATNHKSLVTSNTEDTLNLSTGMYKIDFTGGGAFVLSYFGSIASNTEETLILKRRAKAPETSIYPTGYAYEIRRLDRVLDMPGAGITDPISTIGSDHPPHQNLNQGSDPSYQWENTLNGNPVSFALTDVGYVVPGRDVFNSAKPGYTPYTYPHPLNTTSTAPDDETAPTFTSASINTDGSLLTLTADEPITGVDAADFTLTGTGSPVIGTAQNGPITWNFQITPSATAGATYTLAFNGNPSIVDSASNAMANFSGMAVTNGTLDPDSDVPFITSATINADELVVVWSEEVTGVDEAHFSINGSRTLTAVSGSGTTRTFTVSPDADHGVDYQLTYTPGTTEDLSGNAMAAVPLYYVVNETPAGNTPSVRIPGRARAGRVLMR